MHFHDRSRFEEAEEHFRKALEIDKKVHGPEHPNVASTMFNLAGLLGDYRAGREHHPDSTKGIFYRAEAARLGKRALALAIFSLGFDHPRTQMYHAKWGGGDSDDDDDDE